MSESHHRQGRRERYRHGPTTSPILSNIAVAAVSTCRPVEFLSTVNRPSEGGSPRSHSFSPINAHIGSLFAPPPYRNETQILTAQP
jgi:hypothetical protein